MKRLLENISENIISSLIVVFLLSAGGTWLFFRESIWHPTIILLQSPITKYTQKINWLTLILIYLLIPLCIYFGYKIHNYKYFIKKRMFFHKYGYDWCFNRNRWQVEEIPYCKKHHVQLIKFVKGYACPECYGGENEIYLTEDQKNAIHFLMKPIIMAKVNGHYKKF